MSEERPTFFQTLLRYVDYPLALSMIALYVIGVISIYSASVGGGRGHWGYAYRQLVWGGISLLAILVVLRIGYRSVLQWAYRIYGVIVCCLVLVLVSGTVAKGAQSWFSLGGLHLQPSELGKVALALLLGRFSEYGKPETFWGFAVLWGLVGISLVLVLLQPDLGSALVYGAMAFVAFLVAGAPRAYLLSLVGAGVAMLPVGWEFLKPYQRQRLLVFIDPSRDPLGAGYNVIQSRIAVGSGSIWGKGFLQGTQSKLRFLPEPHTDFVFSVWSEEWGFVGAALVLLLFGILLWRMLGIAVRCRDKQGKVMISALMAWVWFQVFECVGMSMGILPVTGLPLPLLSYGGSALLSNALAFALVMSVGVADELERREFH
ncbi:MAG: rod shape-determining protein RodA [Dethiosulfovibrio peptidovorans]|nr:MAG: rod shape-determining protein RodA [Dethiosulfovibrio peptidovorans]